MKVDAKNIANILALYNIKGEITDYSFFINNYNKQTSKMKIIFKVDLSDTRALVIKLVKEDNNLCNIIERQSQFSEHLRNEGILTPKRYKSADRFCIKYNLNGVMLDVTIEDFLGEEVKIIDKHLANKLVSLWAKFTA